MRILVVEDEPKTVALLRRGFTEEGFVVDVAGDGVDGLHLAATGDYDAVVLDVMLPQRDGWWVLQELRKRRPDQPVIMLSALDAVTHRVQGLTTGADDYLVEPFAFSELNARVRNLLRRGQARRTEVLRYSDLDLDVARHRAARAGQWLGLAPQEYRLLKYLL